MELWERADNYMGPDFSDYFLLYSTCRDSEVMERANYEAIKSEFKAKDFKLKKGVTVEGASHWAVGWVEYILIHKDNKRLVELGHKIREALDEYPVYDDTLYYEMENEERLEAFKDFGEQETLKTLVKVGLRPYQIKFLQEKELIQSIFLDACEYYGENYAGVDGVKDGLKETLENSGQYNNALETWEAIKLPIRFSFISDLDFEENQRAIKRKKEILDDIPF